MNVVFFESSDHFRQWLIENGVYEKEVWVGFYKKGVGKTGISYKESVDEALCQGWIDGIRKSLGAESYTNRFTPRKPSSNWSAVNLARVEELTAEGRMLPSGIAAHAGRDPARSQGPRDERPGLTEEMEAEFRKNETAWTFFQSQAPWYQRTAGWLVVSAKREETRRSRLTQLIECSGRGQRIPTLNTLKPPKTS